MSAAGGGAVFEFVYHAQGFGEVAVAFDPDFGVGDRQFAEAAHGVFVEHQARDASNGEQVHHHLAVNQGFGGVGALH